MTSNFGNLSMAHCMSIGSAGRAGLLPRLLSNAPQFRFQSGMNCAGKEACNNESRAVSIPFYLKF